MSAPPLTPARSLWHVLRYREAADAIEWLGRAFGFEPLLVVPGDAPGAVTHAQLRCGDALLMLGSWRDDDFGRMQTVPADVGGRVTASSYVVVDDVDAHHARAVEAGAEVVQPPADQDYGGRLYVCRDPEGHLWSFGSYDPLAEDAG